MVAPKTRVGWIDLLRVMACFMVVVSHCCDGFVAEFDSEPHSFLVGMTVGSLMRASVPLFVMMTGVLLLPLPADCKLTDFYRKRVGRVIPPLIFWSLALPPLAYLYFTGAGSHSLNPSVDLSVYTPEGLTGKLWTWVLNFNFDTTPLWYLYMLVGLYLIMPVVGAWLRSASKQDVATFLKVWAITLFVPYIKLLAPEVGYLGNYGNMDIFGGCDWNAFTVFHYVSGFIGYIVLAYYLNQYPLEWNRRKLAAVFVPMFVLGYAMTAGGYAWLQGRYPGNYAYLEIVWYFTGVNVMMMTVPLFVFARRCSIGVCPWLRRLAGLTFGIYLCHFIFVMVAYDWFDHPHIPAMVRIIAMSVTVFAIAASLTWVMSRFWLTRRLVS